MRLRLLFVILGILCFRNSIAQNRTDLTQSRILILLDGSSSMINKWAGGIPKFKAAQAIIMRLMDSVYAVNNQVEFSLRVFGHQHTVEENFCYDTKNEVPFAKDNRTQMSLRLDALHPLGVTPIAYALSEAANNDLVDVARNAYSIILITDGGESCGGDICDVMMKLIKEKVYFKPYIVSLEDDPTLKTTYNCMGDYLQVIKETDIPVAVNTIVKAFRPVLKITPADYKQLQSIASKTPSVLKVNIPEVKPAKPIDTLTIKPVKTFKEDTIIILPHDTISAIKPEVHKENVIVTVLPFRPPPQIFKSLSTSPVKPFTIYTDYSGPEPVKARQPELHLPPVVKEAPAEPRIAKINSLDLSPQKPFITAEPSLPLVSKSNPGLELPPPAREKPETPLLFRMPEKSPALYPFNPKMVKSIKPGEAFMKLPPPVSETPRIGKIASITTSDLKTFVFTPKLDFTPLPAEPVLQLPAPVAEKLETPKIGKITDLSTGSLKTFAFVPNMDVSVNPSLPDLQLPPPAKEAPSESGPAKFASLTQATPKPFTVTHGLSLNIVPQAPGLELPPPVAEAPEAPKVGELDYMPYHHLISFSLNFNIGVALNPRNPILTLPPVVKEETPLPYVDKIAYMKLLGPHTFNSSFVVQEKKISQRQLPNLPPPIKEVIVAAKTKPGKPGKPDKADNNIVPPGKRAEHNEVTEDAKETTVEVYFTNGHGKFYPSTPQVVLLDPVTNADIKKFFRTVDANGNPDPQTNIPVGTYNVTFSARRSLVATNVKIEQNKKNKIYIIVKPTNLTFAYADTNNVHMPSSRPVKEYTAIVTERNKNNGLVKNQKCTEQIEYEAGNYHIEINTFPPDIRNTDLDFDLETPIYILQPGFLKLTNQIDLKSVTMFKQEGDRFLPFHEWDLTDPRSGHIVIQPGKYQIHYKKGKIKSVYVKEDVLPFTILSNRETEVIIN